jgi:hypothetical protein
MVAVIPQEARLFQRMFRKHQQARQHPIRLIATSHQPNRIFQEMQDKTRRLDGMGERSTVRET